MHPHPQLNFPYATSHRPVTGPIQLGCWRIWIVAWIGCFVFHAFSAEPKESKSSLTAPGFHTVSLQFKDFKFILDTKLDGSKCSTVVDTGSTFTSIDSSRAKKSRRYDPSRDQFNDPLFTKIVPNIPALQTNFCILKTLDLPGIQILETPAMVGRNEIRKQGELISVQRMDRTVAYATLILGTDFLTRHRALIACLNPASLLLQTSTRATDTAGLHQYLLSLGYQSVPMTYTLQAWEVPLEIDGVAFRLLLDTGAPMTLIDPSLVNGLKMEAGKARGEVVGFGGRTASVSRHLIRSLKVGEVSFSKLTLHSAAMNRWGFGEGSKKDIAGLLGMDILSEGHAIIDCGNHRLYVLGQPSK